MKTRQDAAESTWCLACRIEYGVIDAKHDSAQYAIDEDVNGEDFVKTRAQGERD